jgi:hypothetical protein
VSFVNEKLLVIRITLLLSKIILYRVSEMTYENRNRS